MAEFVKKPAHYSTELDPLTYLKIIGKNADFDFMEGAYLINIIKYVSRFKKKDGLKDLDKAIDYLVKLKEYEQEKINKN